MNQYKVMPNPVYLTAKEAAAELEVSLATLYAYVSRGLIRSETQGSSRSKRYRADDVRTLIARRRPSQQDERKGTRALSWGAPVMDSAITLISDHGLYYRGRDAVKLAEDATLETIATLLWGVESNPFADQKTGLGAEVLEEYRPILEPLGVIERGMTILPALAEKDPGAFMMSGAPVRKAGVRLMRVFAAAIAGEELTDNPLHQVLATSWNKGDNGAMADVVRRALVLCADHELNASTFTVRCVSSTGSSLYYAIAAGLAALKGHRHGGMAGSVEVFLERAEDDPEGEVARMLRAGEMVPGFGHPLYAGGDPRSFALLEAMEEHEQFASVTTYLRQVIEVVGTLTGNPPNLDLMLAGIARQIGRGPDSAMALFALGRTAGWIAHAIEQAATGKLIRPRARYTGEPVKGL